MLVVAVWMYIPSHVMAEDNLGAQSASPYVGSEILVIDPPSKFSTNAHRLGYSIVETVEVTELEMVVQRLRIPAGATLRGALNQLRDLFPDLMMEANDTMEYSITAD